MDIPLHFPLGKPVAITLPRCYDGEAEALCALLDAGAPVIHIRKPDAPAAQVEALLRQLRDAGADMTRLTLHHDAALARRYGLGGIHLREGALREWLRQHPDKRHATAQGASAPDVQKTQTQQTQQGNDTYTPRLSAPAHSWEEAARLAPLCDYVTLSPLFDSVSKPGYLAGIDPADACRRLRLRTDETAKPIPTAIPTELPVSGPGSRIIALGGITPDNISVARAAAFDGAAVIGAVWTTEWLGTGPQPVPKNSDRTPSPGNRPPAGTPSHDISRIDLTATLSNYQRLTRRWQAAGGTLQFISDGDPAAAEAFLQGGGRWVQLRMKDTPAEGIIARGREILALCRRYDALLIVNDDPRLAKAIGADGVHLGQNDTPPDEARIILGRQAIIGCTANTFAHIARIAQSSADYIGLGPFRYTTTKKNLSPILGEEGYRRILRQMARAGIRLPVAAIGGITEEDVPQVMACGVNGIALSGAISRAGDIAAATARFTELVAAHRTIVTP